MDQSGNESLQPTDSNQRVITLDLTLAELNPNHKYRLALVRLPPNHWLADLKFAVKDDSVYVAPLFDHEYTIQLADAHGAREQYQVPPRCGFHLSIHASGVVNVSFGAHRVRLRP